ncbi:MAG TPA: zinc-binding dehydrogenase [Thermoleophilaceae bacterium]|nr:zinc-binding dehydrogenase [Thermoleophilaceae bacterium]
MEITGNPDHVVTIADFTAAEHGVRITTGADGRSWEALDEAARLYEAGSLTMPVEQTFSFEQAPDAHRISQEGHVRGKLVLIPD